MKLIRYRKPSLKSALGITKVKKKINREIGINKVMRYKPSRIKQKVKYEFGLYSKPMAFIRQTAKGNLPKFSLTALLINLFRPKKRNE